MDRFDITPHNSVGLVVDVQARFVPAIPSIAADQPTGKALRQLMTGLDLLAVPLLISEQYPKGLGTTLPELLGAHATATVLAKTHFSCLEDPTIRAWFADSQRSHVLLAGIEAHVCVLATVADLIAQGRWVVVAADAIASRDPQHRDLALHAMRDLGALVLPVESILFRLQRQAGTGAFKALSALVR